MPEVEYRDIPGYPGYKVGSDGTVVSCWKGRWKELTPYKATNGYLRVRVGGKKGKNEAVHRMVLLAFRGPPEAGMQSCHGDGVKTNNVIGNLRWDTIKANHADQVMHGTRVRRGTPKLTADQVAEIRARAIRGESRKTLMETFGMSKDAIRDIINGRTWKRLQQTKALAPT